MELMSSQKLLPDRVKGLEPHAIAEEGKEVFRSEDPPLLMGANSAEKLWLSVEVEPYN